MDFDPTNNAILVDFKILEMFTVEEIDKIQDNLGLGYTWSTSSQRYMLRRREQMEVDIVRGIVDNQWGMPLISKAHRIASGEIEG